MIIATYIVILRFSFCEELSFKNQELARIITIRHQHEHPSRLIEQNPGQFRSRSSHIVILRSFSSRVFHFSFREELSVTNQVPIGIVELTLSRSIVNARIYRVIEQNPPQFRRKRNRHHTLWFSVPRLISVRTWKTSKMERRARDQLLFPFHVSSICGYRVCIAVLDFFSIVHACEETSSTSDFPMWSLAATLRWSCWRRRWADSG